VISIVAVASRVQCALDVRDVSSASRNAFLVVEDLFIDKHDGAVMQL
jgi:hypothetical protein